MCASLIVSERCDVDVALVVENSVHSQTNRHAIHQFVQHVITIIDSQLKLGADARLAVIAYTSTSTPLTSLSSAHNLAKLLYITDSLLDNDGGDSSGSGVNDALDGALVEIQPSIRGRLTSSMSARQAVILLKLPDSDTHEALARLQTLMNNLVDVIVVGK